MSISRRHQCGESAHECCRRSTNPCPCGSGKKHKRCHGADQRTPDVAIESNPIGRTFGEGTGMEAQPYPVHSPLSQRVVRDNTAVDIEPRGLWLRGLLCGWPFSLLLPNRRARRWFGRHHLRSR